MTWSASRNRKGPRSDVAIGGSYVKRPRVVAAAVGAKDRCGLGQTRTGATGAKRTVRARDGHEEGCAGARRPRRGQGGGRDVRHEDRAGVRLREGRHTINVAEDGKLYAHGLLQRWDEGTANEPRRARTVRGRHQAVRLPGVVRHRLSVTPKTATLCS